MIQKSGVHQRKDAKKPIDFFHQQLLGYLTWSNKCSTNQTTQQMDLLIPLASQGWYSIYYHLGSYYKCISNISKPSPTATASLGTCSRAGHFCPSILITTQDPHRRTKSWSKNMKKIQHHKSCDLKLGWEHVIRYPREASRNPEKSALLNDTRISKNLPACDEDWRPNPSECHMDPGDQSLGFTHNPWKHVQPPTNRGL